MWRERRGEEEKRRQKRGIERSSKKGIYFSLKFINFFFGFFVPGSFFYIKKQKSGDR